MEVAPSAAQRAVNTELNTLAPIVNDWRVNADTMGSFGNFYLKRANVAMVELCANTAVDLRYPQLENRVTACRSIVVGHGIRKDIECP